MLLKWLLMRKSLKNLKQGKFKPDVSHFLPTSPVSVATLDFSSAFMPVDYWIAGTLVSLAITPGIMKPKLGMSKTELTPTLPLSCPNCSLSGLPHCCQSYHCFPGTQVQNLRVNSADSFFPFKSRYS